MGGYGEWVGVGRLGRVLLRSPLYIPRTLKGLELLLFKERIRVPLRSPAKALGENKVECDTTAEQEAGL